MRLTRERAKTKLWIGARAFLFALAVLVLTQPTQSRADPWEWLTNLLQDDTDVENASLSGIDLPPHAIVTGRGETRTIQSGADLLELYPASAITVEVSGKVTTVHLFGGTLRAKVSKRQKHQTFEIETADLVATVKGTDFEVSATGRSSAVSVYEGRVAVKAVGRIGGLDVTRGRTATVTSADRAPRLGTTPSGGAAAAARASAGSSISTPGASAADESKDNEGMDLAGSSTTTSYGDNDTRGANKGERSGREADDRSGGSGSSGSGSSGSGSGGSGSSGGGSSGGGGSGDGGDGDGGDGDGGDGDGGDGDGGDDD